MDQPQMTAPVFDRTAEDVGNIVEFGHVNVLIPDQSLATLFYVTGLGFTRDPYLMTSTDNMWINIGTDQFHLPMGEPQTVRGVVGIVVPDLDAVLARLRRVQPKLARTAFRFGQGDGFVDVVCPWGNRLRLHAPEPRFGPVVLGIVYVTFDTPPGSAAGIARFYRQILGALVQHDGHIVRVGAGPTGALVFHETETSLPDYDGNHIQISLADFSGPYQRLRARGLVSEESDQHQYRFRTIFDPENGAALLEMEHEVRSMRHPLYCRPLINRDPAQSNVRYAPGREDRAWSMPLG